MSESDTATSKQPNTDLKLRAFSHNLRVRWAESDMQGVVFNGHYLTYFDIGMTEFLRHLCGGDLERMQSIFQSLYVVRSVLDYHDSAHFDELIDIEIRPLKVGNSSMTLGFEIRRGDDRLVSGENIYVHALDGKSAALPPDFKAQLQAAAT